MYGKHGDFGVLLDVYRRYCDGYDYKDPKNQRRHFCENIGEQLQRYAETLKLCGETLPDMPAGLRSPLPEWNWDDIAVALLVGHWRNVAVYVPPGSLVRGLSGIRSGYHSLESHQLTGMRPHFGSVYLLKPPPPLPGFAIYSEAVTYSLDTPVKAAVKRLCAIPEGAPPVPPAERRGQASGAEVRGGERRLRAVETVEGGIKGPQLQSRVREDRGGALLWQYAGRVHGQGNEIGGADRDARHNERLVHRQ
eukprot:gene7943-biopygen5331